jgi:hypothetical protein
MTTGTTTVASTTTTSPTLRDLEIGGLVATTTSGTTCVPAQQHRRGHPMRWRSRHVGPRRGTDAGSSRPRRDDEALPPRYSRPAGSFPWRAPGAGPRERVVSRTEARKITWIPR